MKAIMISDKAKWCALMMNGDKKVEVRKNKALASAIQKLIDEYGYADIYVYCSKDKHQRLIYTGKRGFYPPDLANGKVLFKFRCYKLDRIWKTTTGIWTCGDKIELNFYKDSCLTEEELNQYFKPKQDDFKNQYGCAINISDLEIFDKPKELSEFFKVGHYEDLDDCFTDEKQINGKWCIPLKKAPQNMVYIEIEDSTHI